MIGPGSGSVKACCRGSLPERFAQSRRVRHVSFRGA